MRISVLAVCLFALAACTTSSTSTTGPDGGDGRGDDIGSFDTTEGRDGDACTAAGCVCSGDDECASGLCLDLGGGAMVCAAPCGDGCADGFECDPNGACVPVAAGCADGDGDGFEAGDGCEPQDCDDTAGTVYPGADELCNDRDDDCDRVVDEGIDLAEDPAHCGACDTPCARDNAVTACVEGVCEFVRCEDGYRDCNEDPADGCEVDESDPAACAACAPLDVEIGGACGTCGSGLLTCDETLDIVCIGDDGDDARNACGGCAELDGLPGDPCEPCDGLLVCDGEDALICAFDDTDTDGDGVCDADDVCPGGDDGVDVDGDGTPDACEATCDPGFWGADCTPCACVNGTCDDGITGTGACTCPAGFAGPRCERCEAEHFGASCTPCTCERGDCADGIGGSGACTCPTGWAGATCGECADTYFGATCAPCTCARGTCNDGLRGDGSCACPTGWDGRLCDRCASGYYGPTCRACDCARGTCDGGLDGTGTCICPEGWDGARCDRCADDHYGPTCTACACVRGTCADGIGGDGTCTCPTGWDGPTCDRCAPGFEGPTCAPAPNVTITVTSDGNNTRGAQNLVTCVMTGTTCLVRGNRDPDLSRPTCELVCPRGTQVTQCCDNGDYCTGDGTPPSAGRDLDGYRWTGFDDVMCDTSIANQVECEGTARDLTAQITCSWTD